METKQVASQCNGRAPKSFLDDCELWFDITQNDYDGDGLTWWQEVEEYGTDPTEFDRTWLFMVYMAADNSMETSAINDFNEMEVVGSSDFVNVVVQLDRDSEGDISIDDWTDTRRFYITQDDDVNEMSSPLIQNIGEANMGDPDSLIDFTRWASTRYKANTLVLILWNHGEGIFKVCQDESSPRYTGDTYGDYLNMIELKKAMSQTKIILGRNIDIIGFDACLMGMVEVGYQMQGSGNIMIASENTIPNNGWPYDAILIELTNNNQMTVTNLASIIVNNYISSYNNGLQGYDQHVTLSAFWIDGIANQITPAVDNFAQQLLIGLPQWQQVITNAREETEIYLYYYYRDLYDFAYEVYQRVNDINIQTAAQEVMIAITSTCIEEGHLSLKPDSHGLSIYWPTQANYDDYYDTIDFAIYTKWDELLQNSGVGD